MPTARVLRWLLVLLLLANLVAAAAWLARPQLRALGWLPTPPQQIAVWRQTLPTPPEPPAAAQPPAASEVVPRAAPETAATPVETATPQKTGELAAPSAPAVTDALPEVAMSPAPDALPCAVVGPFAEQAAAQAARQRIVDSGGSAALRAEANTDYLVFLPPAANQAAAGRTRQTLHGQGIDAYVIPTGKRRHAVSIGVFSKRERAVAQQQRAEALGYAPQLAVRNHAATYRLLARAPAATLAELPHAPCAEPQDAEM